MLFVYADSDLSAVSPLSAAIPEGISIVEPSSPGKSYSVYCSQAMIPRGTRFGPFTGKIVWPDDIQPGQDNPYMWEVCIIFSKNLYEGQ